MPVLVIDAAWQIDRDERARDARCSATDERNVLRRHFTGEPSRVVRTPEEVARMEAEAVADLHDAAGRYPDDEPLRELIADLRATSPRFAELWEQRPVARHVVGPQDDRPPRDRASHARLRRAHRRPAATCGSIVYSAPPGSDDARALALLLDHA